MSGPKAPCLWFDGNADEAVRYDVSVFDDAKNLHVDRYSDVGPDPNAPVVFVEFQIKGQRVRAINGGPGFPFTEAVSFAIGCADQAEVDRYWHTLTEGGKPVQCGWLKDRFGLVPRTPNGLRRDPDLTRAGRVMRRMLQMTKIDIAELQTPYAAEVDMLPTRTF